MLAERLNEWARFVIFGLNVENMKLDERAISWGTRESKAKRWRWKIGISKKVIRPTLATLAILVE